MKQYESSIQDNNNNNNNIIIKKNHQKEGQREASGEGELCRENILFIFFFSFLLSQIYENRTAGFRRD